MLAPYISAVLEKGSLCVVGNEEKINAEAALFDKVSSV